MTAVNGPSWRYNDATLRLTEAERGSLRALEQGLLRDDPSLAKQIDRFGERGRFSRGVGTVMFVTLSAAVLIGLGWITPILDAAFGTPVCVLIWILTDRVFGGPRAARPTRGA